MRWSSAPSAKPRWQSACAWYRADGKAGRAPAPAAPAEADLRAPERIAIDYADAADLAEKAAKALKAFAANQPAVWKALARTRNLPRTRPGAQGGIPLYRPGFAIRQHAQAAARIEPIVAETFAEADRVMTPLLGKPLTDFIFVDQTMLPRSPKPKTIFARLQLRSPQCWRPILR